MQYLFREFGTTGNETPEIRVSINSRIKATKIIGAREAFCRRRIPESNCARKKHLTQTSLQHLGMVTEKSHNLLE